jgi:hypothetical protein
MHKTSVHQHKSMVDSTEKNFRMGVYLLNKSIFSLRESFISTAKRESQRSVKNRLISPRWMGLGVLDSLSSDNRREKRHFISFDD